MDFKRLPARQATQFPFNLDFAILRSNEHKVRLQLLDVILGTCDGYLCFPQETMT